jgi:urease accessory protein
MFAIIITNSPTITIVTGMRLSMTASTITSMAKTSVGSSARKRGARRKKLPDCRLGRNEPIDSAVLYRLMAWLSPAYPVGAFSYSSGIEWAVEAGDIRDAATLRQWLAALIAAGSGFCDAVLFVHAHRAATDRDDATLRGVAALAAALVPSKERFLETTAQGRAFVDATQAAWPCAALARFADVWPGPVALPVAVAVACAGHDIGCEAALGAFLHALTANWISAGVRLIPLGQTDGLRALAALEAAVAATAARALATPLEEIGSATFRADLATMRHETQYTRLFRS